MDLELEKLFTKDEKAFYDNKKGGKGFRGVNGIDTTRKNKAIEQAKLHPIPYLCVFSLVNDCLELIRMNNGHKEKNIQCDCINLDGIQQEILDNGIIVKDLKWEVCKYDKNLKRYTYWDPKYDVIKEKFNLNKANDLVWLKFTNKGHLGVVAKSFDINFNTNNSSGTLVKQVGAEWDDSFVYIFPLTDDILGNRKSGDIELVIGNYLISKGVPIIDFYSHNN